MKCTAYRHKKMLMVFLILRDDINPSDVPNEIIRDYDMDNKWKAFDTEDASPISLNPDEAVDQLKADGWYVNRGAFVTTETVIQGNIPNK